jgi:CBS domain containing-hemolysin-like protein
MRAQVRQGIVAARGIALAALALGGAAPAHASFLAGEALDTAANWLSWFVIVVVPIAAIAGFLYVHVLPEKIAEKRHHPHKDSIKVLCILSLFFGGMLWPFAWLWAYTRPIGYRAIYGTEKHEDYYMEMGEKARGGALSPEELVQLRRELAAMQEKGALPADLQRVLDHLKEIAAVPPLPRAPRTVETTGAE